MTFHTSLVATVISLSALSAIANEKSFGDGLLPELLHQYDINNDGLIDVEERQAIKATLKIMRTTRRVEIEKDKELGISADERRIIQKDIRDRIAHRRADEFAKISGHDEVLSRQEFELIPAFDTASPERIDALFKRLDSDDNGEVNLNEFVSRLRNYSNQFNIDANSNLVSDAISDQFAVVANKGDVSTDDIMVTDTLAFANSTLTITDAPEVALGLAKKTQKTGVKPVHQRYIAVFNETVRDIPASIKAIEKRHGLVAEKKYKNVIRGFSFSGGKDNAAGLSQRADIKYVVPDSKIFTFAQILPTGVDRVDTDLLVGIDNQDNDVINQINVAVLDTGIDADHADLRVLGGKRFYSSATGIASDNNYNDDHGHGTFVAGIIGAIDNSIGTVGVCPGVGLYAVKVLDSNGVGYTSVIMEGLDHIIGLNRDGDVTNDIYVANLSIGGGYNRALNDAIQEVIDSGIVCVVAAGNNAADSANYSPASAPNAITVSAFADSDGMPGGLGSPTSSGGDDYFASFSNYGSSIDICAPGVDIYGPIPGGYIRASGTSFAAPHVSGAAALYLANSSHPYRGETGMKAVKVVEQAILDSAWRFGEPGFLLGEDPDGIPEPVLNIARLELNNETPNSSPNVLILDPIGGSVFNVDEQITLSGAANDNEDGSLSQSINWSSSVDGNLGMGETLLVGLSEGFHVITAEVWDSTNMWSSSSVMVEVLPVAKPDGTMVVSSIKFSSFGGRSSNKHLSATLKLVDDSGRSVTDAQVIVRIINQDRGTVYTRDGVTDSRGSAVFSIKNAKPGNYTLQVISITKNGLEWNGEFPSNSIQK